LLTPSFRAASGCRIAAENHFFFRWWPRVAGSIEIEKLRVQTGATSLRGTLTVSSALHAFRHHAGRVELVRLSPRRLRFLFLKIPLHSHSFEFRVLNPNLLWPVSVMPAKLKLEMSVDPQNGGTDGSAEPAPDATSASPILTTPPSSTGPDSASGSQPEPPSSPTPVSGSRQAFDDVLRPLTEEDLKSPGTQKLILYMLQQANSKNDSLDGYVERFHEADKRAAVLQEQFNAERKVSKVIEIIVLCGTTIGGLLFGTGIYFIGKTPPDYTSAIVAFVLGLLLIAGSITAKVAQR
jgi:hypothetical protein